MIKKIIAITITAVIMFTCVNSYGYSWPYSYYLQKSAAPKIQWYIKLDGHWYSLIEQPDFIWFDQIGVLSPAANIDNCRRSDGQQQQFSRPIFRYGPYLRPIYEISTVNVHLGGETGSIYFLEIKTISGKIICDREVIAPNLSASVFSDSFEDVVFVSSFDN